MSASLSFSTAAVVTTEFGSKQKRTEKKRKKNRRYCRACLNGPPQRNIGPAEPPENSDAAPRTEKILLPQWRVKEEEKEERCKRERVKGTTFLPFSAKSRREKQCERAADSAGMLLPRLERPPRRAVRTESPSLFSPFSFRYLCFVCNPAV